MAADVWLVGPVGLILGSNGSFGDAWVSLLSPVGTALYTLVLCDQLVNDDEGLRIRSYESHPIAFVC